MFAAACAHAVAAPPPTYIAHELKQPGAGTLRAAAINNAGTVTGFTHAESASATERGFVASGPGSIDTFAAFGTAYTEPAAIGATGWIAGRYFGSAHQRPQAFVRDPAGTVTNPFAGDPAAHVEMTGVNAAGTAVGFHRATLDAQPLAFAWSGGTVTWLGTGGGVASTATAINDTGVIAGYMVERHGDEWAFRFEDGKMKLLPRMFQNESFGDDRAYGINAAGTVVGGCHQGAIEYACQWKRGAIYAQFIGALAGLHARALSVNTAGQTVGEAEDGQGQLRAVLYLSNETLDLNAATTLPVGVWLHTASSINDSGWITVGGHDGYRERHFVLEPVPAH
jgi:uncharacterized membrane protein